MTTEKSEIAIPKVTLNEAAAATKIQAAFRGFISRKKFALNQLPTQDLEDYRVLIQGNDPKIKGIPNHPVRGPIALIGTSGMRAVEIACQLSDQPKLIIVDNSKQVVEFWRKAREFAIKSGNKDVFLRALNNYIDVSQCDRTGFKEDELYYLDTLFSKYGENKVRHVIGSATILAQSWADKDILIKIRTILNFNGIKNVYAYPSNIVAYLQEDNLKQPAQQVLQNIAALNPKLAIHTDMVCGRPKNVLFVADHRPATVASELKLDTLGADENAKDTGVDFESLLLILMMQKFRNDPAKLAMLMRAFEGGSDASNDSEPSYSM
jgi:hypothetical protein